MPYTLSQVDEFALFLRQTYEDAEARMLRIVADRISRGITTDGWAEQKLRDIQRVQLALRGETDQLSLFDEQVLAELDKAYQGGADAGLAALRNAGIGAIDETLADATRLRLQVLARDTVAKLQTGRIQILRRAVDGYRDVASQADAMLLTGTVNRRQAAQLMLDKMADSGITGFTDSRGRNWDLASYAEMSARTGSGQAVRQGRMDRFTANDKDLVMISDSPEECETCRPWEGKILSVSGQTAGYQTIAEATAQGLFHPGCTHDMVLYTPGLTTVPKDTENPVKYEERQKQRQIERTIRQWKKREAVAITPDAEAKAKSKIKEWQGTMREFIGETGRLRQRGRESVKSAR